MGEELFKMGKKCKDNNLIWHMLVVMVKNRVGQGCIFHVIIPANYTFSENFIN